MLEKEKKPMSMPVTTPAVSNDISGAPQTMPGTGDGKDKTPSIGNQTGVTSWHNPYLKSPVAPISSDIAGAHGASSNAQQQAVRQQTAQVQTKYGDNVVKQKADAHASGADDYADIVAAYDTPLEVVKAGLERNKPEDEETRRRRERQEKSSRIVSAVSDGLRALANMYFTTQYAPDMYNQQHTQTEAVNSTLEKMRAARAAQDEAYYNYALKLGALKSDRADALRKAKIQDKEMAIKEAAEARDADKYTFEKSLYPDKAREQKNKADYEDARARGQEEESKYAGELASAKVGTERERAKTERTKQHANNTRANANNASANASNARAAKTRWEMTSHKGGGNEGNYHFLGQSYKSAADYERAVMRAAKKYPLIATYVKDPYGLKPATRRPIADIGADIEQVVYGGANDGGAPSLSEH